MSEIEKKRNKVINNYIILIIIFCSCIGLTLYFCKWYEVYNNYKKETPILSGTITEITYDDLDHYVVDASNVIVYMCIPEDDNCRNFEKKFKKYIKKKELGEDIVYLNLSGLDSSQFLNDFNTKYNYKFKLRGYYPTLISFRNGKVDDMLQGNEKRTITISKVEDFFETNMTEEE